ncbi:MAG: FprA family A-type flavoprotein [Chloroflexi bacterium]|nr:FprA family A-type flavoprotein [Chloroflexota bacterium]
MPPVVVKPGIYWIGVNDRTTDLFEGLWPITREGVSYNAYLIDDERKAIIDLAKSIKTDEFFEQIEDVIDLSEIDYVVVNHLEPDHAGIIQMLKRLAPRARILGTAKAQQMLESFYGITDGVQVVSDGETLSLGKHQLRFVYTPFVHWPETMMTYEVTEQVLFSCDGFGGYGALRGALFDSDCTDHEFYERESLRYFVNIVAVFSKPVLQAIDKLADTPISVVAPSHGLVWREDPGRIIELYARWASYASAPAEPGITLIYASMYGNTEHMMNAVSQGVSQEGVPLNVFDINHTHVSYILPSLWSNQGVIVGAPTYEGALFPPMAHVLDMAAQKRIRSRTVARFGSYGWSGGAQRHFERLIEPLKWDLTESFEFVGSPTHEEFRHGEEFGARFGRLIKQG